MSEETYDYTLHTAYHGNKYTNIGYISLGYFLVWIGGGILLLFYVRSHYEVMDKDRSYYSALAFWLFGLAIFLMWLLWFLMYAAQVNPMLHPEVMKEASE